MNVQAIKFSILSVIVLSANPADARREDTFVLEARVSYTQFLILKPEDESKPRSRVVLKISADVNVKKTSSPARPLKPYFEMRTVHYGSICRGASCPTQNELDETLRNIFASIYERQKLSPNELSWTNSINAEILALRDTSILLGVYSSSDESQYAPTKYGPNSLAKVNSNANFSFTLNQATQFKSSIEVPVVVKSSKYSLQEIEALVAAKNRNFTIAQQELSGSLCNVRMFQPDKVFDLPRFVAPRLDHFTVKEYIADFREARKSPYGGPTEFGVMSINIVCDLEALTRFN